MEREAVGEPNLGQDNSLERCLMNIHDEGRRFQTASEQGSVVSCVTVVTDLFTGGRAVLDCVLTFIMSFGE